MAVNSAVLLSVSVLVLRRAAGVGRRLGLSEREKG